MYPLRSQENADEASPAGAFSCYIYLGPLSQDFLPPYLLGVLRKPGILGASVKSLFMPTAYLVLPEPSLPGTGSHSGPEDLRCLCREEGVFARGGRSD